MTAGKAVALAVGVWAISFVSVTASTAIRQRPVASVATASLFEPADTCMACHTDVVTRSGEDVSIAADWRASMMANSSRDPYWQAAVRREVMDHPHARDTIEDECTICHMPMTTFPARASGARGRVFDHLPLGRPDDEDAALAADGVSCTVCHQIKAERFGDPSSFTGGYVIDVASTTRPVFGPFAVDSGRARVMHSSSGFQPTESAHVQQSELCATCHTLFTHPIGAGRSGAALPEQTPYLEWQQSAYRDSRSCQSCHMPPVAEPIAVTRVLGQPRTDVSRHTFVGGNFFVMKMFARYRDALGVRATPAELGRATARTIAHLQTDTARLEVRAAREAGRLVADVTVINLAGHKFPTGYPSRRAWIQLTVTDARGQVVFESGRWTRDGRIVGNDNDTDPSRFEPHYTRIDRADQVQIYESIMGDAEGRVTTGLLTGARYLKDNRLLPRGLRRAAATKDVAVHGVAESDADFSDGADRMQYLVDASAAGQNLTVTATLWFQPIGFRWADNLRRYDAPETNRFVAYFDSLAGESAQTVASASVQIR